MIIDAWANKTTNKLSSHALSHITTHSIYVLYYACPLTSRVDGQESNTISLSRKIQYYTVPIVLYYSQQVQSNQFFNSSTSKDQQHWHNIRSIEGFVTAKFPVRYTRYSWYRTQYDDDDKRTYLWQYRRISLNWFSSPLARDYYCPAHGRYNSYSATEKNFHSPKLTAKTIVYLIITFFFVSSTHHAQYLLCKAQGHKTATYPSLVKMYGIIYR